MSIQTQGIASLGAAVQQHNNEPLAAVKADQARTLTASDTQSLEHQRHLADTTSGSITIALKPLAEWPPFVPFYFQKTSASNTMTLDPSDAETIEGNSTIAVTGNNTVVALYSDGTALRRYVEGGSAAGVAGALLAANNLSDLASAATARTNLGVSATTAVDLKADVHAHPIPGRVDLIGANAWQIRFRMGFAGTFTRISSVMSGATLDANAVGTLLIAGGAVTGGVVTHANLVAAGDAQDQAITAGGAFTADQEIRYTISGANTQAAFAGVTLEYTRA